MNICIIPARGGSRRIPMKNIKEFHGKPIIAYSIELTKQSKLFQRIIVSTDHVDIAAVATLYGAEVFRRDPKMAVDEVGTQDVVRDCLIGIGANESDLVFCIYPTAPMLTIGDMLLGLSTYTFDREASFVFTVGDQPLQDAGMMYIGAAGDFMYHTPLISEFSRLLVIPANRVCDINTMDDWNRALKMYEDLQK